VNKFSITVLAAFVFVAPAHAQNLLLNGSFETPIISANSSLLTPPTSWEGNAFIVNGDFSTRWPLAQHGQQYAGLGNPSASLSQAFTVGRAGNYVLRWYDSTEFNGPGNTSPYTVSVTDGSTTTVASVSLDANALALREWTQRSLPLTLAQGDYTVRFQGQVPMNGPPSLLDNVSLVPEPPTFVLLLTMFGLIFMRQMRGVHGA
jgi:hypothetical protein